VAARNHDGVVAESAAEATSANTATADAKTTLVPRILTRAAGLLHLTPCEYTRPRGGLATRSPAMPAGQRTVLDDE
jgi:hypothetical protein